MAGRKTKYEFSCDLCATRIRDRDIETVLQRATRHHLGHLDGRDALSQDDVDLMRARIVLAQGAGYDEVEEGEGTR